MFKEGTVAEEYKHQELDFWPVMALSRAAQRGGSGNVSKGDRK
jgi:hypothetical protein